MRATPTLGIAVALAISCRLAGGCSSPGAPRGTGEALGGPARGEPRPGSGAPAGPPNSGDSGGGRDGVAAPIARELLPAPPVIAPHGARVIRVALADGGDAALSLDAGGELRLWPALDGTREPIAVRAAAGGPLALGRASGELVAAIVDAAGGGEVQRFDAAGALVGRVAIAAEPAIAELAIAGGAVLARRVDQTIAAYGVRGEVRGRLAAPPGQRLVALVARGGAALAALSGGPGPAVRTLRRIAPGPPLAWGPALELPEELTHLALAPGGRAVAGLAYNQLGRIVELEPRPHLAASIAAPATISAGDLTAIGFLDDGLTMMTSRLLHMRALRREGRWIVEPAAVPPGLAPDTPAAFGDGAVVAGQGGGLAIVVPGARHLGYRDGAAGELAGEPLVMRAAGHRLLWLDAQLRAARVSDPGDAPSMRELYRARPIDATHLAVVQRPPAPRAPWRIAIRDVAAGTEQDVAAGEELASVEYDRGTRVLAAYGGRRLLRYRLAAGAPPVQLRGLTDVEPIQRVYLTDPALAGGVVAVAIVGSASARAYAAPDEAAGASLRLVAKTETRGFIVMADRAGRIYAAEDNVLVIYRGGKPIARLAVPGSPRTAVTEDATRIAVLQPGEAIVFDPGGAERWRVAAPNAVGLAWSGGRLVVSTHAGLMAFDGVTGRRVALACGWSFGLHELGAVVAPFGASSACAAAGAAGATGAT